MTDRPYLVDIAIRSVVVQEVSVFFRCPERRTVNPHPPITVSIGGGAECGIASVVPECAVPEFLNVVIRTNTDGVHDQTYATM